MAPQSHDVPGRGGGTPYLTSLSRDPTDRVTGMEWARYLVTAFGPTGALSALRYYTRLGWIDDRVRRTMTEYVRGLATSNEEFDADLALDDSLPELAETPFERHAKSLEFVAAMGERDLDRDLAPLRHQSRYGGDGDGRFVAPMKTAPAHAPAPDGGVDGDD